MSPNLECRVIMSPNLECRVIMLPNLECRVIMLPNLECRVIMYTLLLVTSFTSHRRYCHCIRNINLMASLFVLKHYQQYTSELACLLYTHGYTINYR